MQQEALWMACHQQVPEDSACGVTNKYLKTVPVGLLVAPHLTLMSEALFSIPLTWLMCVHVYNQLAKTHAAD